VVCHVGVMPKRSRKATKDDLNQLAAAIVAQAVGGKPVLTVEGKNPAAVALGRLGGLKGGKARARGACPPGSGPRSLKKRRKRAGRNPLSPSQVPAVACLLRNAVERASAESSGNPTTKTFPRRLSSAAI
jgi:hypothetical protein